MFLGEVAVVKSSLLLICSEYYISSAEWWLNAIPGQPRSIFGEHDAIRIFQDRCFIVILWPICHLRMAWAKILYLIKFSSVQFSSDRLGNQKSIFTNDISLILDRGPMIGYIWSHAPPCTSSNSHLIYCV